jgi:protein-tyrosine-phosphatase
MKTVLFVCSGNTCRSPLAEAVARDWFAREADKSPPAEDVFFASAGMFADDGLLFSPETNAALRRVGIECSGRSKQLNAAMIRKADVVLCMTAAHLDAAKSLVADGDDVDTVIELLDPSGDIDDPIGRGQKSYDDLVTRFRELIPRRVKETLFHEDRARVRPSR